MEEPLRRGETVALANAPTDTVGLVLSVTADGTSAEVRWQTRPGHEHELTVEPTAALRRIHESEITSTS